MLRAGLAGGGARNQNDTRNPQDTGYRSRIGTLARAASPNAQIALNGESSISTVSHVARGS
jgi:hypothetical protein